MKISKLFGKRFKEKPAEATLVSHSLLLRGGYIRQAANGIYQLLPLGLRTLRNIETIVREEMEAVGAQEVLMPVVLPGDLWEESGRYSTVGPELAKLTDRTGHKMVLAMTHEEAAVDMARNEIDSYKNLPLIIYQIQTKFRDEPRSRGGLIRLREFTMKDAYSFHADSRDLGSIYMQMQKAYKKIFARVGIPQVLEVQSDSGMMGGDVAHEYMLLSPSGEDTIVQCTGCGYIANLEVAKGSRNYLSEAEKPLQKVETPGKKTIADVSHFLGVPESKTAKAVFYEKDSDGIPVLVLIRGDLEVNEAKLSKVISAEPADLSESAIRGTGAIPGYASGIGLTNCRIIADVSVKESSNLIAGANEENYHYLNFNLNRECAKAEVHDLAVVVENDRCQSCGGELKFYKGIEVGNIFQLGMKYTQAMGMTYLDRNGKEQTPLMGCYGIGISRLISAIVEAHHDKYGPVWPVPVAPFHIYLVSINLSHTEAAGFSGIAYKKLIEAGYNVAYDDREERPGVKFADAELIGSPLRLVFSAKNVGDKTIEWKARTGNDSGVINFDDLMPFIESYFGNEKARHRGNRHK